MYSMIAATMQDTATERGAPGLLHTPYTPQRSPFDQRGRGQGCGRGRGDGRGQNTPGQGR